ncbi:hypothetical protein [Paraliomyxa miuraensis]|uniref:hypothetical protein n=1 Tax=Paraliomyxa miuraensis TaxID=376150 RepID=UPI00225ACA74|nr:hypothetical protein [Paraliomyxa miuraensis]MCX4239317.1 hypothetical protein [Paraliomyxa miuraensis]
MSSISHAHGVALALTTLTIACTGHSPAPRGAAPVEVVAGPLPAGPSEPATGLPMPSLDVPWTPPVLTAGDPEPLRAALADHDSIALHLGRRFQGSEQAARVEDLVHALHPGAAIEVLELDGAPFDGVALPLSRVADDGSARPRYQWTGEPLPVEASASAVLMLDEASLSPAQWGALPAWAVGSCEAPMAALAAGQEQALAELEPFLDHADAVLWQVYRPALVAAVASMSAELAAYEGERPGEEPEGDDGWTREQCGHAYRTYLQDYARCGTEAASCSVAPRMFLVGGARIGTIEPSVPVPERCAATMGRDYALELRAVAAEAAQVAQEHLAPSWAGLADRLGAITEVYEALDDVCAPRRRRFDPADLEAARARLAAIGKALASPELGVPVGRWVPADASFHVPGLGAVRQLTEYDAGPGSGSETAVAQARALRELLLRRALCRGIEASDQRSRRALPLVAALVDARSGEVEHFGYFFEEELLCGELPPLGIEPSAVAARSPHGR